MDHSGVVVPNKLASYNWERCPDWDGRMVLRLSQGSSHWLVWQGPLELFASIVKCELPPDYNWQWLSIEKPSGILSELNVGFLVDNKLRSVWLAVELVNLQSVDLLVDRFGLPPQEVYRDWQYQIETSERSSRSSLDALSHVLVLPDGRLVTISSIESLIKKSVLNPIHFRLLDCSLPIPEASAIQDIRRSGPTASRLIDEFLNISLRPTSKLFDDAVPPATVLSKSTFRRPTTDGTAPKKRRSKKMLWTSIAATGMIVVGGLTMLTKPSSKQQSQNEVPPPIFSAEKNIETLPELTLAEIPPTGLLESTVSLELTQVDQAPDNTLTDRASSSLQNFLGGISGGKAAPSIDAISFESVEAILKQTNDEAIVQQSLSESSVDTPTEMVASKAPFSEPIEAIPNDTMSSVEPSSTSASAIASDKHPAASDSDQSFIAHTVQIQQAQSKTTVRVPFKPNERQAVCRVRLKIEDRLLLKPAEAIELVGRQDAMWTVALHDDCMSMAVYLRSVPGKSWYIGNAVRLRLRPEFEVPIGPKDVTQICLRLQNYLRWLDQNRMVGESLRSNKKTRSMAMAGLEEIEKQTKAAEKSLKNWLAVEKLVLAFYQENAFELEFASSREKLPQRK